MSKKIAINGFGRIGRCIVRALSQRGVSDIELVALNDLTSPETLAHLYNYDTVHGRAERRAVAAEGRLLIDERSVRVLAEKDPARLPWGELGVDIVLECTGLFSDRDKAAAHLAAGARKVIIGAPAKGHDATIVLGVNTEDYDGSAHTILSCGSCTTNCLAPVAKVLLEAFGLERGLMTTTHAYTNDQVLLDVPHRKGDLRRARAAAQNIVPTSSGAAKALSECLPALAGRFDGQSMRVPTMDVSLVDLTFESTRPLSKDAIHAAMKRASEGPLLGILGYTEEPLVSSDYLGDPRSAIFDATLTQVIGERFAKVFAWYDNEWGFSNRMVELAQLVAAKP
ncbi:type I glyceraldehyde-3-phosphate dehydrogenase [Sorangium sp. So ce321]|uniref:type I glyceraldehyde-3-phosphate dehydrogenase n=1 Tax=Sorangium sp. So ce321 TaxID=3133300 RepID=UPI003F63298D